VKFISRRENEYKSKSKRISEGTLKQMYRSKAIFFKSFEDLTQRWNLLGAMEVLDLQEFNQLKQETLKLNLDVSKAICFNGRASS
jgi:ferredoxin-fold anticodon binding domain-containing protein